MRLSQRTQKWILAGIVIWLMCGVLPANYLYLVIVSGLAEQNIQSLTIVYGLVLGVATIAAIFIHPKRSGRIAASIALLWIIPWGFWIQLFGIVRMLNGAEAMARPRNNSISFDEWLGFLAMPSSAMLTALLLGAITRSWRVLLGVVCASLLLGMIYLPDGSISNHTKLIGFYLWHPIVVGTLMLWAIPKRIRPFPAHACQSCGYDLRGLESGMKCPECGN